MDIISTLFSLQSRKIGIVIPDVVITEKHSDTLEITEHPVESPTKKSGGASADDSGYIADHAYRRPSELVMEVGFAGGGSLLDLVNTSNVGLSIGMSPKETYEKLLDLQRKREPFDVVTGKRMYSNMLIRVLDVTTDKHTENVLMATLVLREIIITESKSITGAGKANMKEGVSTSAIQDTGVKTAKPVTNESMISRLKSAITG
ncbi:hypothetical protein GKQ23_13605 [Erwinia sp. E602]|uniref:phage baseplate protein n=1 Tax=Erwinia sp. E602 TaxID=2675378 RepID=UPI001BAA912E|nr:hypothetical protein [Erwinia sp. E602]QUG75967.1 hypothetical protein GKQ23_13605 [Erwinia sp. E602]